MSRAFRLGLFILAALLILVAGVFLIGNNRFLFRHTYRLDAEFQTAAGLVNGADVQVGGIHMGTVKQISLPNGPGGKVEVVMDLANSTKKILRRDSVATIQTEGLLGNKYVQISFGSEKAPPVETGDTIKGETPVDFQDAALQATKQTQAAASAFADDANAMKHNFLLRGFFKKRGYDNPSDLQKNKISQLPARPGSKTFTYDAKTLFDKPDDAKLKNEKKLNEAGQYLEQNQFSLAVVAASDETGDTDKDRTLTLARAFVVRDYLVQHYHFDDKRVKIIGLGKSSKPESSKVEIHIYDKD